MCGPVPLAVAAGVAGIAQTAMSVVSQAKAAKAQNKAIASQLATANEEARQAATVEMFDSARAMRREQALIRTSAGEAGLALSSGSIEGLLFDAAMQTEMRHDRTLANQESRHRANVAEATSMYSQVDNVNALTAGLQLGGSVLNGWSGIEAAKIKQREAGRGRTG